MQDDSAGGETAPSISYIVCTTPRSGSTLLCEALNRTGMAGRPEEYFVPDSRVSIDPPVWRQWDTAPFAEYLARVVRHSTTPNGVFATKFDWDDLQRVLAELSRLPDHAGLSPRASLECVFPNLHVIWVTRRDKVRQAVSLERAQQTLVFMVSGERPPEAARQPTYSFTMIDLALHDTLLEEAAFAQFFTANGIAPLTVVYEDFVLEYEATVRRVLEFIGVPTEDLGPLPAPTMRRQADAVSEEWVRRYRTMAHGRGRRWRLAGALRHPALIDAYLTPYLRRTISEPVRRRLGLTGRG